MDQSAGHVHGSTAEIWTNKPKIGVPMLNILHFHINDMSEDVTIDQRWLTQEERDMIVNDQIDEINFKEFKKDVTGQLLRYLILIYDQKVLAILYNQSEASQPIQIRYREFQVDMDVYQKVKFQRGANQWQFGKISFIPYQMLSSANKSHLDNITEAQIKNNMTMHCTERSFVRMPGYVDLDIYSMNSLDSVLTNPIKIAAPICKCKPAEDMQILHYEAIKQSSEEAVFAEIQTQIQTLMVLTMSTPGDEATLEEL